MNLQDVRTLLDYHYWARDRLLEAVETLTVDQFNKPLGSSFSSVRDTVVHVYAAEHAWYSRWQGVSPPALLGSEGFPDVPSIRAAWLDSEARIRAFVESFGEGGGDKMFEFRNLAQKQMSAPLWLMVQHIVNHASYHRGQVTTMLRQMGAPPAKSMDLIAFYYWSRG